MLTAVHCTETIINKKKNKKKKYPLHRQNRQETKEWTDYLSNSVKSFMLFL